MIKPKPEHFGLTTETVKSLTEEQAQRSKRRRNITSLILKGLWLLGAALWLTYNVSIGRNYVELTLYSMVVAMLGLIATIASFGVVAYLSHLILPDPPEHAILNRFQEAGAQYEAWFIRTQETFWETLTGRGFEIEVTNLLNRAGHQAHLTPASGDGGVDIVLGDGTIVQCKAHSAPASPGVVRELYGSLIHQNAPKAMLISLSGVTNGVHAFIKDKPITVWDKSNLIALQKALDKS